jgi:hypothetical protein
VTPEIASLLLRQHAALMEEGIGPENGSPEDLGTLHEAWALVRRLGMQGFTVHWGYEYGFVESSEHSRRCDCTAGKVYRGELEWCQGCQKHVDLDHDCGSERVKRWFTS